MLTAQCFMGVYLGGHQPRLASQESELSALPNFGGSPVFMPRPTRKTTKFGMVTFYTNAEMRRAVCQR